MPKSPKEPTIAARQTIPILEETASIEKHEIVTGRVRVTTDVQTFNDVVRADLRSENVEVRRVPIGIRVEGPLPQVRTEGDVTIVPIFEEEIVVETRLVLKEEVHIVKSSSTQRVEEPVVLKRQRAKIERPG